MVDLCMKQIQNKKAEQNNSIFYLSMFSQRNARSILTDRRKCVLIVLWFGTDGNIYHHVVINNNF